MVTQNAQTILALFDSFALADAAAKFIKVWEKGDPDVKFGAVTLVCEGDDGQIKVRNYGTRNTLQGIVAGSILGLIAGRVLGFPFIRGLLVGAAIGAAAGSMTMQEPELSTEMHDKLATDLKHGRAGLIIPLVRGEAEQVVEEIEKLDGEVKKYDVIQPAPATPQPVEPVPV